MADEGAWAQLVCTTDAVSDPVAINKDKFVIGRAKTCDLCLAGNKLVSAHHCFIEKDNEGKIWLQDSSTNGTLLNMSRKIVSGKRQELKHGDEIHIVYRKNDDAFNVAYLYQDMKQLELEEMETTQEYSSDLSTTAEEGSSPLSASRKRSHQESSPCLDKPVDKKSKLEDDQGQGQSSGTKAHASRSAEGQTSRSGEGQVSAEGHASRSAGGEVSNEGNASRSAKDQASAMEGKAVKNAATNKMQPVDLSVKTKENIQISKEVKDGENVENNNVVQEDSKLEAEKKSKDKETDGKGEGGKTEKPAPSKDDFEESLICIICQEILHDCISLQPCMHSFCAGCYSDWMARSNECPSCRMKVERINKNHLVNNLVEAYLTQHPDKRRPEEDLKDLDSKNKITKDMLYPKRRRHTDDFEDEEDEEEYDGSGTEDGGSSPPAFGLVTINPFSTSIFTSGTGIYRPPKTVCRQCPEYKEPGTSQTPSPAGILSTAAVAVEATVSSLVSHITGGSTGTTDGQTTTTTTATTVTMATTTATTTPATDGATNSTQPGRSTNEQGEPQPSTSGETSGGSTKVIKPPDYICRPTQVHILCQCCLQPMPDRRIESTAPGSTIPPMQCRICYRGFCHAYWGCRKADCNGCIGLFKDLNFNKKVTQNFVLDNPFESEVLRNYLEENGISLKDVLKECLQKLDSGEYLCQDKVTYNLTSNSHLCYGCGLRNFRDLVYMYRRDLSADQLPGHVTSRPDCYWGKNCRTQKNKPHHAMRYNHICDQTRTS